MTHLGIDIGGTFTDFVLVKEGQISIHKRLTTSDDPAVALLAGVLHLSIDSSIDVVHGSTIATNALLERRGAKTALITTKGFADVIEIGRQNRPDLYALNPRRPEPLVPAAWRFEIDERVTANGQVLTPLSDTVIDEIVERVAASGVESAAVCLLFSFLYPEHEQRIGMAVKEVVSVSLSSEILPEYREYERASTTVINAYVAPLMERYLNHVETKLGKHRLRVMQSNGGVITAATARREAARTVLSGPAGGAVGAFHVAHMAGIDHIISFDMGGTSTDVALFPGEISYTHESLIDGMPLRLPIVDIHTVGAGGGSIARVDAGGALRVGPESAGADPGPACYGKGNVPTTSDANLILGRLNADHFLGGHMKLDVERAHQALTSLANDMGVSTAQQAAWGVVEVANTTMQRAIRRISVERGYDPRVFTLVPFGGAGSLHACALARSLQIPRILIPAVPGVLSALGMTIADLIKDYSVTIMVDQTVLHTEELDQIFTSLEKQCYADLTNEDISTATIRLERALDLRYSGQSYEITVSQPADNDWLSAFHTAHEQRYGYQQPTELVEVVNVRLKAIGIGPKPVFEPLVKGTVNPSEAQIGSGLVWFDAEKSENTPFYRRDKLLAGNQLSGPAVIFQLDTTIIILPEWWAEVDSWGNIILTQKTD